MGVIYKNGIAYGNQRALDATLTQQGEDADAKAVGDALALKAGTGVIADDFSTSQSYAIGDYTYYNGSLYRFTAAHSAGAWVGTDAQAVQLAEDVVDLKNTLNYNGLFPIKQELTIGFYDLSTGVVNSNTGYLHSPKMECSDYTKIGGVSQMTENADFCSLFLNGTYVGYVYTKTGRYVNPSQYTVDSITYDHAAANIQGTTRGIVISEPAKYSVPDTITELHNFEDSVDDLVSENGMDYSHFTFESGYYNLTTGEETSSSSYHRTGKLSGDFHNIIDPNNILPDTASNFISLWKNNVYVGYYSPNLDKYVDSTTSARSILYYDKFAINVLTSYDETTLSMYPVFNGKTSVSKITALEKPFLSLKACFIGDSITYGVGASDRLKYSYVSRMQNEFLYVYDNGISSTSLSGTAANAMCNRYSSLPDGFDLVSVFGGTNDYFYDAPMGTTSDNTNITFYGALNILMQGLLTKYTAGDIIFITPMSSYYNGHSSDTPNTQGKSLKDYRDAIIERCEYYGIPCLDLFSMCGMDVGHNEAQRAYYSDDGVHPNDAGYERIYKRIIGFLKTIL